MLPVLIPIAALLLSDALLLVGHGLLLTMLPIAAASAGFSDTQVALTGSAYFLGFVSGCLLTPYAVRRVGHIRSFAVLATAYSALVLVFPMLSAFVGWLLLRFLVGAAISGLYMIIESWLNERATGENRGTLLSIYTVINLVMMTVGQQLLNLSLPEPFYVFGLAAILLSLAIIPVSLTLTLAPVPLQNVKISLRRVWQLSHVGIIGAVVSGLFAFTAVCLFFCFVIIMVRRRIHVLPVEEVVEPFRAVAETTTPTVFEMDPRTGGEAIESKNVSPDRELG